MFIRAEVLTRALVAPLSALIVALSVAVPMMERADLSHAPVVESEHDPGRCAPSHDHTICTQAGANLATPAPTPERFRPQVVHVSLPSSVDVSGHTTALLGPPSRAPPSA